MIWLSVSSVEPLLGTCWAAARGGKIRKQNVLPALWVVNTFKKAGNAKCQNDQISNFTKKSEKSNGFRLNETLSFRAVSAAMLWISEELMQDPA